MNTLPASVKLTPDELDKALGFIEANGASDFFPFPFEIRAIRACWDKVRPVLEGVELLSYNARACYEMDVPKQRCLVRPVHLLDPLDLILYTALTLRLATVIESKRASYQTGRVFSWHYDVNASSPNKLLLSDWDEYKSRALELSKVHTFVGTADIVDFFSRVYLHRLENALHAITSDRNGTLALMRLVNTWSHGTSYGIPCGPFASNVLSECLLIEVDEYLLSCRVEFIRFADDYLIFGNTAQEVTAALFQLGTRLHQTQGLSLNAAKTRIRLTTEYRKHVLESENPAIMLRNKIRNEVFRGNPYAEIDYEHLSDEQKAAVNAVDAKALLEEALDENLVNLPAVKFVLTFLSALRRPDLVGPVLDNLDRLFPVSDSVARFFDSLDGVAKASHANIGARLLAYIASSSFTPDFQAIWLLDPFTKSSNWNNLVDLRNLARNANSRFVRRQAVLGMRQTGDRSALLDAKSALDHRSDWEQRAILFACAKLPKDEWEAIVAQSGGIGGNWSFNDCLQKAILKAAPSL